jgi:tRNA 5-methylaminomethyl-2-thiouridine biosynthesis bifunctional protein
MPRLDRGGVLSAFYLAAYLNAVAAYEALGIFERIGVEQRADDVSSEALADLLRDPPLPEDWFAKAANGSAFHARAGVVRPHLAAEALLRGAQVLFEAAVQSLEPAGNAWTLRAPDGRALLQADAVILACGAALSAFAPARFLPITLSRGQVEWGEGRAPAHAITCGSYLAPYEDGVLFGATFDKVDEGVDVAPDADSRMRNFAALQRLAPEIAASIKLETLQSRASVRATAPDYAPIAGLLPDAAAWRAQYAELAHGRMPRTALAPPAHRGVYVLGGLGARGLALAPLLGEMIAGEMFADPPLLPRTARDALHPARFLLRALKRG